MPSRHGIEPWIGGLLACGVAWASWSALAHGATLSVANREYLLRLRLLTRHHAWLPGHALVDRSDNHMASLHERLPAYVAATLVWLALASAYDSRSGSSECDTCTSTVSPS